jgi:hypothetical protein
MAEAVRSEAPPALAEKRWHRWIEWGAVATIVGALIFAFLFYRTSGYLPLPFFPDPNDVYADGYSTAWWTWNGKMYEEWRTVYPPLSFVLLKLISNKACYDDTVMAARECDWTLWFWTLGFYCLNGFLAYRSFRYFDRSSAAPRAIAFTLGLPTLYGFEHLNLLVFTITGFIIGFGPVLRSSRLRWIGVAVAINLKPYMLGLLLAELIRKRWRWVEGALITTVIVYVISFFLVAGGSPLQIWSNIVTFADDPERSSSFQFVVYAASYTSMIQFLHGLALPLTTLLGSNVIETSTTLFTVLVRAAQAITIFTFLLIWYRPEAVPRHRVTSMALLLLLISTEPGGYTIAASVFLIFCERFRGWALGTAIILTYVQCMAIDIPLFPIGSRIVYGYLAGHDVRYYAWVTLGPFLRPGMLIITQMMLVVQTISEVNRYQRTSQAGAGDLAQTAA